MRGRMFSLDNAFGDEDVADFLGRVRRFLTLPADAEPVALHRRAQDRRPVLLAALRERQAGASAHARRRADRRGRDRQCPHTSRDIPRRCCAARPTCSKCAAKSIWRRRHFAALNAGCSPRRRSGKEARQFANPRNAAAGSLRQKDAGGHRVSARCASSPGAGAKPASCRARPRSASDPRDRGDGASRSRTCSSAPSSSSGTAAAVREDRGGRAPDLPFDIDGVVYKVDRLDWQAAARLRRPSAPRWGLGAQIPRRARRDHARGESTSRSAAPAS